MQLLEVIGLIGGVDKFVEGNGGKVANGNFVLAGVLQDLGAKVARLDASEVLLVALGVASILQWA